MNLMSWSTQILKSAKKAITGKSRSLEFEGIEGFEEVKAL